jgi:hypothetical protein
LFHNASQQARLKVIGHFPRHSDSASFYRVAELAMATSLLVKRQPSASSTLIINRTFTATQRSYKVTLIAQ